MSWPALLSVLGSALAAALAYWALTAFGAGGTLVAPVVAAAGWALLFGYLVDAQRAPGARLAAGAVVQTAIVAALITLGLAACVALARLGCSG